MVIRRNTKQGISYRNTVFKIVNKYSALSAETFFKFKVDSKKRGHSRILLERHSSRDIRFHFFSERVINRWNCLLSNAVEATSVNSFKSKARERHGSASLWTQEVSEELYGQRNRLDDRGWPTR